MPFKKPNSPYWKVRCKNLPGYGDTGTLSTRVRSKAIARQMEHLLFEIAEQGLLDARWHGLLDALRPARRGAPGRITLPDLMKARSAGRLRELLLRLEDPPLQEAVEEFLKTVPDKTGSDKRVRRAMRRLLELAPKRHHGSKTTLGYLRDGRVIKQMATQIYSEGNRTRNGVLVTFLSPVSMLLVHHYGKAERDRIWQVVHWKKEDDTRDVFLSPSDIGRLLQACRFEGLEITSRHTCDPRELYVLVLLALATGADRTPLVMLACRDVSLIFDKARSRWSGQIFVRDKKASARTRTVVIGNRAARALVPYLTGTGGTPKAGGERLFTMKPRQVTEYFRIARAACGLSHVRFKDLRSQFAIYADRAGLTQATVKRAMGHARLATTQKYLHYEAVMSSEEASAVEQAMGFERRYGIGEEGGGSIAEMG